MLSAMNTGHDGSLSTGHLATLSESMMSNWKQWCLWELIFRWKRSANR